MSAVDRVLTRRPIVDLGPELTVRLDPDGVTRWSVSGRPRWATPDGIRAELDGAIERTLDRLHDLRAIRAGISEQSIADPQSLGSSR